MYDKQYTVVRSHFEKLIFFPHWGLPNTVDIDTQVQNRFSTQMSIDKFCWLNSPSCLLEKCIS